MLRSLCVPARQPRLSLSSAEHVSIMPARQTGRAPAGRGAVSGGGGPRSAAVHGDEEGILKCARSWRDGGTCRSSEHPETTRKARASPS